MSLPSIRLAGQAKRMKTVMTTEDGEYFKSYSDLYVHEEMLRDYERTSAYRQAICENAEYFQGKTVLDVGAGTGILSCFCAKAGAAKVYAIEASEVAKHTRTVVAANELADTIEVIQQRVEDCALPTKVDIIVSEWMGYMLLFESMLNSVIVARDRWLKPGGLMFPCTSSLFVAPVTEERFWAERVGIWSQMKSLYDVDMSCLLPVVQQTTLQSVQLAHLCGENVLAHAQHLFTLDLLKVTECDLAELKGSFSWSCHRSETMHGVAAWFVVVFPGKEAIKLSTSPDSTPTHWQQSLLFLDEPLAVEQDTEIDGEMVLRPNANNHRFLDVHLSLSIARKSSIKKLFCMTDQPC